MSLMTYVLTSTAAFALAVLTIGRIRGISNRAILTILAGGMFMALYSILDADNFPPWSIYPLLLIGGASFIGICTYPRELVSVVHEGEVALSFLTATYLLTEFPPVVQKWVHGLTLPLTLWLAFVIFSSKPLSKYSRLAMAFLFSMTCAAVCIYQVYHSPSIFYSSVKNAGVWTYFAQSFVTQISIFWAGFHSLRLFIALPWDRDTRTDNEIAKEMIDSISEGNVPVKMILLAGIVHGLPLLLNFHFKLVPVPLMISYAALVSPYLVQLILGAAGANAELPAKKEKIAA